MVCFEVEIAVPLSQRHDSNNVFLQRIDHLRKHYNGDPLQSFVKQNYRHLRFAFCDEDAVGFLRDVPHATICVQIKFIRTDILLYSNYKYTGTSSVPPKQLLLKKVYWMASSLERWYQPTQSFQKLGI
jgi:hypothetical protein